MAYNYLGMMITSVDNNMGTIKILVADKHPVFREGLSRLLAEQNDLQIVAKAIDGYEAVSMAEEVKPDVAIIDINLPKLDGIEVTKQIKASCSSTAILILSEYDLGTYLISSLRAGALGYMVKTCPINEIINAIHLVHAGEEVLSTRAAADALRRFANRYDNETKHSRELHRREIEILRLIIRGMSNKDIARELYISQRTVQSHLVHIYSKLGVDSRTAAAYNALREGWLTLDDLVQ